MITKDALRGWPHTREDCWGRHTYHIGVIKGLKAISAVPKDERSVAMERVASKARNICSSTFYINGAMM